MELTYFTTTVLVLILSLLAVAAPVKRTTGSYTVSGLGTRKVITAAGGTDLDLAIAMMETENMQATYTYSIYIGFYFCCHHFRALLY